MKCIGIIGAMEIEVNRLKEKVKNCSVETVCRRWLFIRVCMEIHR